jgi:hypothetical protein
MTRAPFHFLFVFLGMFCSFLGLAQATEPIPAALQIRLDNGGTKNDYRLDPHILEGFFDLEVSLPGSGLLESFRKQSGQLITSVECLDQKQKKIFRFTVRPRSFSVTLSENRKGQTPRVLVVRELSGLPLGIGPESIPVVHYSEDLLNVLLLRQKSDPYALATLKMAAQAELLLEQLDVSGAATLLSDLLQKLRKNAEYTYLHHWLTIRLADCALAAGEWKEARAILLPVSKDKKTRNRDAAPFLEAEFRYLAKIRLAELNQDIFNDDPAALYDAGNFIPPAFKSARQEIVFRLARTLYFAGEDYRAYQTLRTLKRNTPTSNFLEKRRELFQMALIRAIETLAKEHDQFEVCRIYREAGRELSTPYRQRIARLVVDAYWQQGLYKDGKDIVLQLLEVESDPQEKTQLLLKLAKLYLLDGDLPRARKTLKFLEENSRALKQHPDFLQLLSSLAWFEGKKDTAVAIARTILAERASCDGENMLWRLQLADADWQKNGPVSASAFLDFCSSGPGKPESESFSPKIAAIMNEMNELNQASRGDCNDLIVRLSPKGDPSANSAALDSRQLYLLYNCHLQNSSRQKTDEFYQKIDQRRDSFWSRLLIAVHEDRKLEQQLQSSRIEEVLQY